MGMPLGAAICAAQRMVPSPPTVIMREVSAGGEAASTCGHGNHPRVCQCAQLLSQLSGEGLSLGHARIVYNADVLWATHRSPFTGEGVVYVRTE